MATAQTKYEFIIWQNVSMSFIHVLYFVCFLRVLLVVCNFQLQSSSNSFYLNVWKWCLNCLLHDVVLTPFLSTIRYDRTDNVCTTTLNVYTTTLNHWVIYSKDHGVYCFILSLKSIMPDKWMIQWGWSVSRNLGKERQLFLI